MNTWLGGAMVVVQGAKPLRSRQIRKHGPGDIPYFGRSSAQPKAGEEGCRRWYPRDEVAQRGQFAKYYLQCPDVCLRQP